MVRDERLMLPLWLNYYRKHFADADLYVLDHETTDGSTDNLPVNVIPVTNGGLGYDHEWMREMVQAQQRELLARYDVVLYTDVDEIVVHPNGIGEYARSFPVVADRCTGFHVRQLPGERPLSQAPLTGQRSMWQPDSTYNKPLLSTVPLDWVVGYHRSTNLRLEPNGGLVLMHLHWACERRCLRRHAERMTWQWDPAVQARTSEAWQWRLEENELRQRIAADREQWQGITEWCLEGCDLSGVERA